MSNKCFILTARYWHRAHSIAHTFILPVYQPEESSIAAEIKVSEIAAKIKHAAALDGDCSSLLPTSGNVDQNDSANVETELRTTELLDQISKLELAQSALKGTPFFCNIVTLMVL